MEVSRQELYQQVWETPISQLAPEEYGVSDVALQKVCKKLHVPTPPRGYWAKRQHGQDPPKEPLPDLPPDAPSTHVFHSRGIGKSNDSRQGDASDTEKEDLSIPPIDIPEVEVPTELSDPHPLVKRTRDTLEDARVDNYGRVGLNSRGSLGVSVNVSPDALPRALRILDSLVKTAESIGWEACASNKRENASCLKVEGEGIPFRITEKTNREETEIPESERSFRDRKYTYIPTGRLYFTFPFVHPTPEGRKKWTESEERSLEEMIPSVLERAHEAAYQLKRKRKERRREQQIRKEKQRKREAKKKRRQKKKRRRKALEEEAIQWQKSRTLRRYVEEVARRAETQFLTDDKRREIENWLGWAREHADRLDPLSDGLPTEKE